MNGTIHDNYDCMYRDDDIDIAWHEHHSMSQITWNSHETMHQYTAIVKSTTHLDQWLNHSIEILTRKPKKQSSVAQRTDTPPTREVKRIPIRIGRWHACGPPRPWLSPTVRTPRRRCRWPKGFRIGIKHFLKSQQTVSTKTCPLDKNRDHMIVFACLM